MGRLLYIAICSLDGYIADADGNFDWSMPDEEVHAFVNDLERPAKTHLYGRRLYEVMRAWETMDDDEPVMRDFAESWRAADKIVFSRSLSESDITTKRTELRADFEPDTIRDFKSSLDHDLTIGGADLAGQALAAGLVDDLHLLLSPVIIGSGTRALRESTRLDLDLVDTGRFTNGVVHLHYRAADESSD